MNWLKPPSWPPHLLTTLAGAEVCALVAFVGLRGVDLLQLAVATLGGLAHATRPGLDGALLIVVGVESVVVLALIVRDRRCFNMALATADAALALTILAAQPGPRRRRGARQGRAAMAGAHRGRAALGSRQIRAFLGQADGSRSSEAGPDSQRLVTLIDDVASGFDDLPVEGVLDLAEGVVLKREEAGVVRGALAALLHNVRVHAQAARVTIHADCDDTGRWEVTVQDDATGFVPRTIATGYGLTHQVAEALREHRSATPGAVRARCQHGRHYAAPQPGALKMRRRVAAVDDHQLIRDGLRSLLPTHHVVAVFADVASLLAERPSVDVVLVDLELAGVSDDAALQGGPAVRSVTPDIAS